MNRPSRENRCHTGFPRNQGHSQVLLACRNAIFVATQLAQGCRNLRYTFVCKSKTNANVPMSETLAHQREQHAIDGCRGWQGIGLGEGARIGLAKACVWYFNAQGNHTNTLLLSAKTANVVSR